MDNDTKYTDEIVNKTSDETDNKTSDEIDDKTSDEMDDKTSDEIKDVNTYLSRISIPNDLENGFSQIGISTIPIDEVVHINNFFNENFKGEISERNASYTELLQHYVFISKVRNIIKECCKTIFILVLIAVLIVVSYYELKILKKAYNSEDISVFLEFIPIIVTAITGFVATIISVPLVITKYLFNPKEENYMSQIILHTQNHDVSGLEFISNSSNNKQSKE